LILCQILFSRAAGGYPVRLSRKGAELVLPPELSLESARKLMTEAQQFDGILEIRGNGDIVLTDEAYQNFKDTLGVDCKIVRVEEAYEQWIELKSKFYEFASKHGVKVPS